MELMPCSLTLICICGMLAWNQGGYSIVPVTEAPMPAGNGSLIECRQYARRDGCDNVSE